MDWLGVIVGLSSSFLLPTKRKVAIAFAFTASLMWFMWGAYHQIWSVVFVHIVYMILHARTFIRWHLEEGG